MPGSDLVNQIDHVLIAKRHSTSIIDVKASRGPNCDSDHYMVKTVLREKIATVHNNAQERRRKWDTGKFKNEVFVENFQKELNGKLKNINKIDDTPERTIEKIWKELKDMLIQTGESIIGEKKKIREEWFDEECKIAIDRKNKARQNMLQRNTRANHHAYQHYRKEAKKFCKKKKKEWLKGKVRDMEETRKQHETRDFYRKVRAFKNDFKSNLSVCKNAAGEIITDEGKVLEQWKEYFEQTLNNNGNNQDIEEELTYYTAEVDVQEPTLEETLQAINKLRNNKSPGQDMIVAEMIKNGGSLLADFIHNLICKIWRHEHMPDEWNEGLIFPVHKKGDKMLCKNYRGITLLSTVYKIFSNILVERLKPYTEEILRDYQSGFRPNRSTTDQIFILKQAMEKFYEYNKELHLLFIDFKQAFDSIDRKTLLKILRKFGIPLKLIALIEMSIVKSRAKVLIGNKTSTPLRISSGVKQGDALSAIIFNLALHEVLSEVDVDGTILHKSRQICAYADDVTILTSSIFDMREVLNTIYLRSKRIGLRINEDKTKYMKMRASEARRCLQNITLEDFNFECVSDFKYLGAMLSNDNSSRKCIQDRLQLGNKAFYAHRNLLRSKYLSRQTKLKLYTTLIRPIVTYGSETWTLTAADENDLRIFERKIIRRIYGLVHEGDYWRIRSNSEINEILENADIVRFIKARRISWIGHVVRMDDSRRPKRIMEGRIYSARRQGRPRNRWKDQVEKDLGKMKKNNWRRIATHRTEWAKVVEEAKAHIEL